MKPAEISNDAKRKPTFDLRFKGGRLQQRWLIEDKKTTFYIWLDVPAVAITEDD